MDQLYHLSYKSHCAIENIKEPIDDVILFVRTLINTDDEAYATYSDSDYGGGNEDDLNWEYDDYEEDIFNDLEYYGSDSEEEEDQDDAIDFSTLSERIYVL